MAVSRVTHTVPYQTLQSLAADPHGAHGRDRLLSQAERMDERDEVIPTLHVVVEQRYPEPVDATGFERFVVRVAGHEFAAKFYYPSPVLP